ncbi:sulfatase-like hydrolase/transferase [Luteolibacter algae]|uniref:Sulfatase-like hydrolase/transferase n=1 Tax=Luteolibacter algae TaxID=454151 RepID=A0ABW5D251_9BACT
MSIPRLSLLAAAVFLNSSHHAWSQAPEPITRPNFVFILTDDQRYDQLGCTGNEIIQTPEIDKLAAEGVLFGNAHVTSAICTPSRVSILLSQFERKHGVNFNSGTSVSEAAWEQSYPVVMRKNGYYTGYIGKNHAPIGKGGYESGVMEKSFDYWYAGHGHIRFYSKLANDIFKGAKADTEVEILDEGIQDFLANEHTLQGARHFLDERPDRKPFCLSICLNVPHGAAVKEMKQKESDPEIYRSLYRDKDIPFPRNFVTWDSIREPKLPADIHFPEERQSGYNMVSEEQTLREMMIRSMQTVTGIDKMVGNLRRTLEKKGLAENTIIVLSSDHGLMWGEFGLGGKALCYEVCTHVPLIIYNPKDKSTGEKRTSGELVQSIDIAPTMLDFAGIEAPETFQGKSLKPLLEGKVGSVREHLYTENLWSTQFGNPRCESVQDKEWKYIRYYKNQNMRASAKESAAKLVGMNINSMLYAVHDPDIALYRTYVEGPLNGEPAVYEELYHLAKDPDETTNLAADPAHSGQLEKLRKVWELEIKKARGEGKPEIHRYTNDSMAESGGGTFHD